MLQRKCAIVDIELETEIPVPTSNILQVKGEQASPYGTVAGKSLTSIEIIMGEVDLQ